MLLKALVRFAWIVFLFGCENSTDTSIELTIMDKYTSSPLAGHKVELWKYDFVQFNQNYKSNLITTLQSDSDGKISYSFDSDSNSTYVLDIYDKDGHCIIEKCTLEVGKPNIKNLSMKPHNYFKIQLVNSTNEFERIDLNYGSVNSLGCTGYYNGAFKDTLLLFENGIPEDTFYFNLTLYWDRLTNKNEEILMFIPESDTFHLTIER